MARVSKIQNDISNEPLNETVKTRLSERIGKQTLIAGDIHNILTQINSRISAVVSNLDTDTFVDNSAVSRPVQPEVHAALDVLDDSLQQLYGMARDINERLEQL